MKSDCQRTVTIKYAEGFAEGQFLIESAKATASENLLDIEAKSYEKVKGDLNFNTTQLNRYLYLMALQQQEDKTLIVGVNQTILQLSSQ